MEESYSPDGHIIRRTVTKTITQNLDHIVEERKMLNDKENHEDNNEVELDGIDQFINGMNIGFNLLDRFFDRFQ